MMGRLQVTRRLHERAREVGFSLFGVAAADPSDHADHYREWIARDLHGEMAYLSRPDAVERRADPAGSLPGVRSIVVVGHEYGPGGGAGGHSDDRFGRGVDPAQTDDRSRAIVARYARGADYHDVVLAKLEQLGAGVSELLGPEVRWKAYVDTGPVLEREVAQRAGLGWFGRNTMLIDPERGSWFVLGVLLVDRALEPTPPFEEDRCGTCRACIDACPTGALLGRDEAGAPILDARKCISYLTIELKGTIDPELRTLMGNRVFGCDICQEVCPWNERFGQARTGAEEYRPARQLEASSLVEFAERLLPMSEKAYQREFADSPLARPRRRGMLRNLCVGIGNWLEAAGTGDSARANRPEIDHATAVLRRALEDTQPLVRGHAAWALGRSPVMEAGVALENRLPLEEDDTVRSELLAALAHRAGTLI